MELTGLIIALFGAVVAIVGAGVGSSLGIGMVGTAANGLLAEEPEKFGTALLLVAFLSTQGIYGFLTGFLAMMRLGVFTGTMLLPTVQQGFQILVACLPIAITGFFTGIYEGQVCSSGIGVVAKHPEAVMKALIFAAMIETYAVLGLITSVILLFGVKL
jgi:V/A-type H+-transporting ATPase subunit K